MIIFDAGLATATGLLLFSVTVIPNQQLQFADAGAAACVDYQPVENTITITCNASFLDVVNTVNDQSVLEELGDGEYF
jgi:hypothetical protein